MCAPKPPNPRLREARAEARQCLHWRIWEYGGAPAAMSHALLRDNLIMVSGKAAGHAASQWRQLASPNLPLKRKQSRVLLPSDRDTSFDMKSCAQRALGGKMCLRHWHHIVGWRNSHSQRRWPKGNSVFRFCVVTKGSKNIIVGVVIALRNIHRMVN